MKKDAIDFVLLWVDENDAEWQDSFLRYKGEDGDKRLMRFRDMGTLRFWFRSVEKFAPWVNKIYFVTCGHYPEWLNKEHPKLVCVRHDDYIPQEYLPTFSANTIELNLHRIPELSDQFVFFNDDIFLLKETKPEDFFQRGLPCDEAVMEYYIPQGYPLFLTPVANASLLNRHFRKKEVMLRYFGKFFSFKYGVKTVLKNAKHFTGKLIPGFYSAHLSNSFLKSTFEEVWAVESDLLDEVCRHKFRVNTDVNQWALQGWQFCTGRFSPRKRQGGCFYISSLRDAEAAAEAIISVRDKIICLNDENAEEFEQVKSKLCRAFESRFPQKSSFEW